MKKLIILFVISFIGFNSYSQKGLLQSGPMLGYSDFREVLIWVQTTSSAQITIEYQEIGGQESYFTEPITTKKEDDFIVKIFPTLVDYGKTYSYKLYINDILVPIDYKLEFTTQSLWQWREDAPNFTFAIGSCFYANEPRDDRPSKAYGSNYDIFNAILAKDPDFMLWLGDNTYLRTPDFLTENGIRHRYRHTRAVPELQALLGSVHHYAAWDDHDYGPNDSNSSYVNKEISQQVFNDYWGNLNTNAAGNGGITSHFLWGDVEVFILDNRFHRDPNELKSKNKTYFGKEQINWLINALASSKASFKIIVSGGQIISDAAIYENYATYPEERMYFLDLLQKEQIEGVLFITGDRHHTEVSKLDRQNAYSLVDITCSPLTAGIHKERDEGNNNLVSGKSFFERNFGVVNVTGPSSDRRFTLDIYDSDGKKVWDYTIKANDLKY